MQHQHASFLFSLYINNFAQRAIAIQIFGKSNQRPRKVRYGNIESSSQKAIYCLPGYNFLMPLHHIVARLYWWKPSIGRSSRDRTVRVKCYHFRMHYTTAPHPRFPNAYANMSWWRSLTRFDTDIGENMSIGNRRECISIIFRAVGQMPPIHLPKNDIRSNTSTARLATIPKHGRAKGSPTQICRGMKHFTRNAWLLVVFSVGYFAGVA